MTVKHQTIRLIKFIFHFCIFLVYLFLVTDLNNLCSTWIIAGEKKYWSQYLLNLFICHIKTLPFWIYLCYRQKRRHLPTWSTWSFSVRRPQTLRSLWGLTWSGRAWRSNSHAPSRAVHPQRSHGKTFQFFILRWPTVITFLKVSIKLHCSGSIAN